MIIVMPVLHRHCLHLLLNRRAPAAMPRLSQLKHWLNQLKHRLNQLQLAVTLVALGQAVQKQGKEKVPPAKPKGSIMHLPTE